MQYERLKRFNKVFTAARFPRITDNITPMCYSTELIWGEYQALEIRWRYASYNVTKNVFKFDLIYKYLIRSFLFIVLLVFKSIGTFNIEIGNVEGVTNYREFKN